MKKIINLIILAVLATASRQVCIASNNSLESNGFNKFSNNYKIEKAIGRESPTTPSREGDEEPNPKESSSIIVKQHFRDGTFNVGVIGHHYEYYIDTIEKCEGVYSHYNQFVRKSLLEAGSYTAEWVYKYSKLSYQSNTIYYSQSINLNLESSLNSTSSLDFVIGNTNLTSDFKIKSDWTSEKSCGYYKEIRGSEECTLKLKIDQSVVKYCPDAYNIGIGLIGTYYKFTVNYVEYENWWGSDYKCSEGKFDCVIANESNMALSFVYTLNANSEVFYYSKR